MDPELERIWGNIQKMIEGGVPNSGIDEYLAQEEGFTPEQFKAAMETGRMPRTGVLGDAANALRAGMQGAMFGFGDEAAGGIEAGLTAIGLGRDGESIGDAYTRMRDAARAQDDQARLTSPASSMAGEVTGGIASALLTGGTAGLAKGAAVAKDAPALLRAYSALGGGTALGKTAAIAGAQGAAQGLGASRATDVGGAALDTALGATLGAGAGALGHGVASTFNRMRPVDRAIRAIKSMVTPGELKTALDASRRVSAPPLLPEGSAGSPLAEVSPRLRSLVAPAAESNPRAADALLPGARARAESQLGEEARQLALTGEQAQKAMNERLNLAKREVGDRVAGARARAQGDLSQAQEAAALAQEEARIGARADVGKYVSNRDAARLRDALTRLQKVKGGRLYEQAISDPRTGMVPIGLRGAPAMQDAVELANKRFSNIKNPSTGKFGDMRVNSNALTARDAQVIDQALRDMSEISPNVDPITKGNARSITGIADEFKTALDQQFPKLAKANKFYADRAAELDALDLGAKALQPSRSASDIALEFGKLTPGQQKTYRSAIASAVRRQIDNGADPLALFGKDAMLDKLKVVGGEGSFAGSISRRNRAIQAALDKIDETKTATDDMIRNERTLAAESLAGKRAEARSAYKDTLAKTKADIEANRAYDAVGMRDDLQRGVEKGLSKEASRVVNNPINNAVSVAGGVGGFRGFAGALGLNALGRNFFGQQAKSKMILDAIASPGAESLTGLLGKGVERAKFPRNIGLLGGAVASSPAIPNDIKGIGALTPLLLREIMKRASQSQVGQAAGGTARTMLTNYTP